MSDLPADPYECERCAYQNRVLSPCIVHLTMYGLDKIHHPEQLRQAILNRNRPERVMPPDDVVPAWVQTETHRAEPQTPPNPARNPERVNSRHLELDFGRNG